MDVLDKGFMAIIVHFDVLLIAEKHNATSSLVTVIAVFLDITDFLVIGFVTIRHTDKTALCVVVTVVMGKHVNM